MQAQELQHVQQALSAKCMAQAAEAGLPAYPGTGVQTIAVAYNVPYRMTMKALSNAFAGSAIAVAQTGCQHLCLLGCFRSLQLVSSYTALHQTYKAVRMGRRTGDM